VALSALEPPDTPMVNAARSHLEAHAGRSMLTRIYDKCGVASQAEFFRLVYPTTRGP
jgi:hypothetical protein